ncbi:MAG: FixH family protein [Bdellovibrionales bacterium]|nr:FixH family protein [Bdellovibrionales bacterium]
MEDIITNKSLFLLFIMAISLLSCGESPLLNHKNEKSNPRIREKSKSCLSKGVFSGLCFNVIWSEGPATNGESKMKIRFWLAEDAENVNVEGLEVELWMPEHGHGSSPTTVNSIELGSYEVSDVYFIMPGFWEVRITAVVNGNRKSITTLKVNL